MAEHEDEWEAKFEVQQGTVKYRVYKERNSGSRDQLVVHTYEGAGVDRVHEVWRFWIIDEEDQECKYKTTRGKAEPADIALFGVQEYGWDCLNFDLPGEEEINEEKQDTYQNLAEFVIDFSSQADTLPERDLLFDAFVSLNLAAQMRDPAADDTDVTIGEFIVDDRETGTHSFDMHSTIPEHVPQHVQAELSDRLVTRLNELFAQFNENTEPLVDDQRAMRLEDLSEYMEGYDES